MRMLLNLETLAVIVNSTRTTPMPTDAISTHVRSTGGLGISRGPIELEKERAAAYIPQPDACEDHVCTAALMYVCLLRARTNQYTTQHYSKPPPAKPSKPQSGDAERCGGGVESKK